MARELKISDELSAALEATAQKKGKTLDELGEEAVKRYLARNAQ